VNYTVSIYNGTLTVNPLPTITLSGFQWLPTGQFQISLQSSADTACRLEASTNLSTWVPVLVTNLSAAALQWIEPAETLFQQRYYRVVVP
jgi:hypothetical protein